MTARNRRTSIREDTGNDHGDMMDPLYVGCDRVGAICS